jgi:hypothetical protein
MKKLEPWIGKRAHDGGWLVEPGLRGVSLQKHIDREGPRMGHILVKVRDDLEGLDIDWDYPRIATSAGLIPDTSRPKEPSGGYHVGYAYMVRDLVKNGAYRIELDWDVSDSGRTKKCTRWIDVVAGEVMAKPFPEAFQLLAKFGALFEEVDQIVTPPRPAPAPKSEPEEPQKPAFTKAAPKAKPKRTRTKKSE